MKKQILAAAFVLLSSAYTFAQDDLLKELESEQPKTKVEETATFKGLQIGNMQSTKMAAKGEWYFLVSHRFGDLTQGFNNFFGLDNALTKIGGIYGINNWLTVSVSRHTYNKIYETGIKYRFAKQEIDGFPITIVGYNTIDVNSALKTSQYPYLTFNERMAYTTQLLVSRKFNEKFSGQLTPIYVHKNLYDDTKEQKNLFLLGAGARYKITKRMSINLDYSARMDNLFTGFNSPYHNPVTLGWDIETGGHIFQLVFSNSQKMNDVAYYSNATDPSAKGAIYFGFNMYRVF